ncbi:hypothetical protein [Vibrio toranzoniae]|uniref:hypothetical protein n=1 Tax=Vibrio toranzoniae TaxID=1194427 RepID=UPI00137844E6|nr:hypothetical protein [Vibrio toranzoniae]NAZ97309.1 hypothetical protein [Vibrio toranzoniae]
MEQKIPKTILNDILFVHALQTDPAQFNTGDVADIMNNDSNEVITWHNWYHENGGLLLISDSPNSTMPDESEDSYDHIHDIADNFSSGLTHIKDDVYRLNTFVCWDGCAGATFSCEYDFKNDAGLPASMYEAYHYLKSNLSLPSEVMIELFSIITFELPLRGFDTYDSQLCNIPNTMGYFFDVEKAIEHDLRNQGLIS